MVVDQKVKNLVKIQVLTVFQTWVNVSHKCLELSMKIICWCLSAKSANMASGTANIETERTDTSFIKFCYDGD